MDELSCRCATFITNVLDSDNDAVSYAARHGVYSVGCCRRLVVMLSSVASDMVFSYKTLHLLRNLLFMDMFGILSLLMLFILHAVY